MSKRLKPKADPFARYASEPVTTTRRYLVPLSVIKAIRNVTPVYGSQGRALQVGTEILIRQKHPVKVPKVKHEDLTRMTYKLLPRTIELLDKLNEHYGSHAAVFCAILLVLKDMVV